MVIKAQDIGVCFRCFVLAITPGKLRNLYLTYRFGNHGKTAQFVFNLQVWNM